MDSVHPLSLRPKLARIMGGVEKWRDLKKGASLTMRERGGHDTQPHNFGISESEATITAIHDSLSRKQPQLEQAWSFLYAQFLDQGEMATITAQAHQRGRENQI